MDSLDISYNISGQLSIKLSLILTVVTPQKLSKNRSPVGLAPRDSMDSDRASPRTLRPIQDYKEHNVDLWNQIMNTSDL